MLYSLQHTNKAMTTKKHLVLLISAAAMLSACGSMTAKEGGPSSKGALIGSADFRGVELAQRALPTSGKTATTNAHIDHVYLDPGWSGLDSLETIDLEDAIQNDVLITSDFAPQALAAAHLRGPSAQILRLPFGQARPSPKESFAGAGMDLGIEAFVNFDLGSSEMINPERLTPLIERAGSVAGEFVVLAYTDSLGTEPFNKTLAKERADQVAFQLQAAGVNASRIKSVGVGVSQKFSDHASNRHAVVLFYVED